MNKINISILILLLITSCVSNKSITQDSLQKEVYKVSELYLLAELEKTKKSELWINPITQDKLGLGYFKVKSDMDRGKIPIERHIKDSVFRKEILTKENIAFFKQQIEYNRFRLIPKQLFDHPKLRLLMGNLGSAFYMSKNVFFLSPIMFTKDGKYALFYVSKARSTTSLWVYKKENGKWKYYKAFHVGIS